MVDRTGRNIIWVIIAVVTTLTAHMMLAFTFWNPWIAMVMPLTTFCAISANFLAAHIDKPCDMNGVNEM